MVRSPLLAAALVMLGVPACAHAAITLDATSSPPVVSGPPPWTGSYRIAISTGDLGATMSVFAADGYSGISALNLFFDASGAATFVSQGAGSARGPLVADRFSPDGVGPCLEHGRDSGGYATAVVSVPPHSTGFVEAEQVLPVPPWPGDDLGMRFEVDPVEPPPGFETLPDPRVLELDGPRLDVAQGVRIRFTSPRPRYRGGLVRRSATTGVADGGRVRIRGIVRPRLRGQVLRLVESRKLGGQAHLITRVRVDRRGRFAYAGWRPTGAGVHFLGAVYRSQAGDFADSRTRCGPVVIVRKR